ncbi:ATP-binding protein [Nocardioides marmoriginsengisoli]|nr:helix-turn-helix domain-containing protein [Nocardioides marmoriginsengisoli]
MPGAGQQSQESFATRLRDLRERVGLTQQELAEKAGLTPHGISALERGTRTRPYPHTIRSIADALEVDEADRSALIAAAGRRAARPAPADPATPDRPAPTLDVPPTVLHGRASDIAALGRLILDEDARVVTLTGPGGVGKTRLAAAVADAVADRFADGVVAVSLVSVTDAGAVLPSLARALGLAGSDGPDVLETLVDHLRPLQLLLVVDNLEHLLSAAPPLSQLTSACPRLTLLATSRSPLRIRAELEYAVEPLGLPGDQASSRQDLEAAPSGAFLLERALAVAPQSTLDEDDLRACIELCHRLAGLPLAIELATAHLRVLTPRVLVDRLEEATATSAARDLPARQRTMRATLDWSLGLLSEDARWLFQVLGAFRGGATLDAVESVVGAAEGRAATGALALLNDLVEHSLVVVRPDADGTSRFTMLEPVAQYARSLLAGEEASRVLAAHAAYGLELARRGAIEFERDDQIAWLARIEAAEPNLLIAVERSLDSGDDDTASLITWYLWLFWWMRGQVSRGRRLAELCLAADPSPEVRCRVALTAATMSYAGGDVEAAHGYWSESGTIAGSLGDAEVMAKARAGVGLAALATGDLATAEPLFTESLELCEKAGPAGGDWLASLVHVWLGTLLLQTGKKVQATSSIERGLVLARSRGDRLATFVALYNLSQAAIGTEEYDLARAHLEEGITLSEEVRDLANLAYFTEALADVEAHASEHSRVATLLGAATALREAVGADVYTYYLPDAELRARTEAAAREALGDAGYEDAFRAGTELEVEELIDLALSEV